MKLKKLFIFTISIVVLMLNYSCQQNKTLKENLIGSYQYTESDNDSESKTMLIINNEYKKDLTSRYEGKFNVDIASPDFTYQGYFSFSYDGTWHLEDSTLTEALDIKSFKYSTDSVISNDEIESKILTSFMEEYLKQMCDIVTGDHQTHINTCNDTALILHETNGNIHELSRLK